MPRVLLALPPIVMFAAPAAAQDDFDGDGLIDACVFAWSHMGHESYGFAELTIDELESAANNFHLVPYQANPDGTCPPREEATSREVKICTFGLGRITDANGDRLEWRWNFGFHSIPYYEKQLALNPDWVTLADGYTCPFAPPADWDPTTHGA